MSNNTPHQPPQSGHFIPSNSPLSSDKPQSPATEVGAESGNETQRRQYESKQEYSREMTFQVSPYLPPGEYRAYAEISPQLAEKILDHNLKCVDRLNEEANANALAQRETQKKLTAAAIRDREVGRELQRIGQAYAGKVIIPGGFFICLFMIYMGHPAYATGFGSVVLVALVTSMLVGKSTQASQAQKAKDPPKQSGGVQPNP